VDAFDSPLFHKVDSLQLPVPALEAGLAFSHDARTDGLNGVRVVATLEAAQQSLDKGGVQVEVDVPNR
jgi:hypothetical protein